MKIKLIFIHLLVAFSITNANKIEDIFTDYCQPGLCKLAGTHSGCKDGVLHNGELQYPTCSENASLIPLTDSDKQLILDFHNMQRNFVACGGLYKDYGIGPGCRHAVITWDKELEKTAFLHTSYCTFDHDKCRNTLKYPYSGQNLGLLTFNGKPRSPTYNINIVAYLWYVEYMYAKMDMIDSFYPETKWKVGHFLTSLNERNNRVGCTLAKFYDNNRKADVVMLSCNYPTTNIIKSTIYNSCKEPASKCTSGTDAKYKFLCSSKEIYDVSGKLKYAPYDGTGKEIFDNCGRLPELFHYDTEGGEDVKKQHVVTYPDKPLATEKPEGPIAPTTKKPGNVPGLDWPAVNPNASGVPDYPEHEYDPPDSSSRKFWNITPLNVFLFYGPLLSILCNFWSESLSQFKY